MSEIDSSQVDTLQIAFPLEFVVRGTPVSIQTKNANARDEWKARVLAGCREKVDPACFATSELLTVVIYYFATDDAAGDVDNCVKLILDAMVPSIMQDDAQVESVVVRRYRPNMLARLTDPTDEVLSALRLHPPVVYVALYNDPYQGMV